MAKTTEAKKYGRFDWKVLLDGKRRTLKPGIHFATSIQNFRVAACLAAKRLGVKAQVHQTENGNVRLQATSVSVG